MTKIALITNNLNINIIKEKKKHTNLGNTCFLVSFILQLHCNQHCVEMYSETLCIWRPFGLAVLIWILICVDFQGCFTLLYLLQNQKSCLQGLIQKFCRTSWKSLKSCQTDKKFAYIRPIVFAINKPLQCYHKTSQLYEHSHNTHIYQSSTIIASQQFQ